MKFLKEGFRSNTVRLHTKLIRCTTVCLPFKVLLLKICIYLTVIGCATLAMKLFRFSHAQQLISCNNFFLHQTLSQNKFLAKHF